MEALIKVLDWLRRASQQVGEEYMMLPVAGSDPQYRERVYCYEFYHQLRCQWDPNFEFSPCGEIDKRDHAYVQGKHLDMITPDLLVHQPGDMNATSNLLAIEVKPANALIKEMRKDLRKLTALRRDLKDAYDAPANYNHALFWLFGLPREGWPEVRSELLSKDMEDIDTSLLRCFVHEGPGAAAMEVAWD